MINRQENKITIELKSRGGREDMLWFWFDLGGDMGFHGQGIRIDENIYDKLPKEVKRNEKQFGIEYINLREVYEACSNVIKGGNVFLENKIVNDNKTYLIKNSRNGFYKIGRSKDPLKRERTLQSEEPLIKIVKIWDKNIEKELHNKYKEYRLRGEWFRLNKVQVKYICTHYNKQDRCEIIEGSSNVTNNF